jgi:ATP-dependent exoDNAse (exonuclease V) alpha subunit
MCTSGARLQMAIAPAGAGKTTAMRALTLAWTEDGGQVIGLAPSAAAAAVLGEQTGIRTDTFGQTDLAATKRRTAGLGSGGRTGDVDHHRRGRHGRHPSLDTAVRFAIDRGTRVRLIGDDQQLAAIGAGGLSATSRTFTAPST